MIAKNLNWKPECNENLFNSFKGFSVCKIKSNFYHKNLQVLICVPSLTMPFIKPSAKQIWLILYFKLNIVFFLQFRFYIKVPSGLYHAAKTVKKIQRIFNLLYIDKREISDDLWIHPPFIIIWFSDIEYKIFFCRLTLCRLTCTFLIRFGSLQIEGQPNHILS